LSGSFDRLSGAGAPWLPPRAAPAGAFRSGQNRFPRGEAVERSETDEEYGRRSDGLLNAADLLPRKDFGISLERCTEL